MTGRTLVAAASTVVTVLVAAGASLAIRLELTGLGRPRDVEPRLPYLILLGLTIALPVVVTIGVYRWAGISGWVLPVCLVAGSALLVWAITGIRVG